MTEIPDSLGKLINLKQYTDLAEKYCKNLLTEISEYIPKDYPTKPDELIKFDASAEMEKRRQVDSGFWQQSVVQDYVSSKWEFELYNRSNFLRMHELLVSDEPWPFGSGTDPLDKLELRRKLTEFHEKIIQTPKPYKALMIDFKKYPFTLVEDPEVAAARVYWSNRGFVKEGGK